jgi:predicted amidohydrolase
MRIALAQIKLGCGTQAENLEKTEDWCRQAADQGADLILLPELWASGYDIKNGEKHASRTGEGSFLAMENWALKYGISIGGSLLEQADQGIYNTFALYHPDQSPPAFYRKTHLFGLLGEDKWLLAGDKPVLVDTPWGKTGLAICYDLRFPHMFRWYAQRGATFILISAVWPQKRIPQWQELLKARAIENQVFIGAVNRTGKLDDEKLGGSSVLVDPMGLVRPDFHRREELMVQSIDFQEVRKVRDWMGVLDDQRSDLEWERIWSGDD